MKNKRIPDFILISHWPLQRATSPCSSIYTTFIGENRVTDLNDYIPVHIYDINGTKRTNSNLTSKEKALIKCNKHLLFNSMMSLLFPKSIKIFILAVDTALKPLLKLGIKPDAVITLDAQSHSLFAFLGTPVNNLTLFADIVSPASLIRKFPAKNIIYYDGVH